MTVYDSKRRGLYDQENENQVCRVYPVDDPFLILSIIVGWMSSKAIVPDFWAIVAIIVIGLRIVVLQSEMTFFAPRKKE